MNAQLIAIIVLVIIVIILVVLYTTSSSSYKKEIDDLNDTINTTNEEIERGLSIIKANTETINTTKNSLFNMTKEKNICDYALKEEKNEASRLEATISSKSNRIMSINQELASKKNKIDELTEANSVQEELLVTSEADIETLNNKNINLYNAEVFKIYNKDVHANTELYSRAVIKKVNYFLSKLHTGIKALQDLATKELIKTSIQNNLPQILRTLDEQKSSMLEFSYFTDCLLEFLTNNEIHDRYMDFAVDIIWKIREDPNFRIKQRSVDFSTGTVSGEINENENENDEEETIGSIIEQIGNIPGCIPAKSVLYYYMGQMTNKRDKWILYPIICTIGKKGSIAILNEIIKLQMFTDFPNLEQVKEKLIEDISNICECSVNKASSESST